MDLLRSLRVNRHDDLPYPHTAIDWARPWAASSAPTAAVQAPQSSPLHLSQPAASQPFASSQGFSLSQDNLRVLDLPLEMERPPSCGQPQQDENQVPHPDQRPRLALRSLPYQDNVQDFADDFSDRSCSPGLQGIDDWMQSNPDTRGQKLVSATVHRSTGEWATKLQHRCDQRGVRPEYYYQEVSKGSFTATLEVGGRRFVSTTPHPSKKLAKEEVCKLALEAMPAVEKMEGVEGAGKKGKKRKSEEAGVGMPGVPKSDRSEDWITLLNLHYQQSKRGNVEWEDFLLAGARQRFSSKLTIPERAAEPFASENFLTKKDARAAAAKSAVSWLRDKGAMSDGVEKRLRRTPSADPNPVNAPFSKSLPEQVRQLGMTLGLKLQPKWVLTPSTLPSGEPIASGSPFYDCHAEFDERDTIVEKRLRGAVGEVKHCLGQKKAKEACCELVIPVLEDIKRKRLGPG